MWFVTRRRHNTEITALRSYNDALRKRCETAEENERAERAARRTITRQHAELDTANRRLAERVAELGRRLDTRGTVARQRGTDLGRLNNRLGHLEADFTHIDGYAARMENRLDRALKAAARYLAAYHQEKRRADRLQQRLDDALGLNAPAVLDGIHWQHNRPDTRKGAKA